MNKRHVIFILIVALLGVVGFNVYQPLSQEQTTSTEPAKSMAAKAHKHTASGVVSIDIKYVNDTLHLLSGKIEQGKHGLWYQSSQDQGKTWSESVNATAGLDIQAKFHRGNDARLAVQGNHIVAVWMSKKEGAPHNAGPMMSVRSADGGQSWQLATMPADWQGPHGFFAMDGNDEQISLVWLDSREQVGKGSQGLRYSNSTDGGLTWSKNLTLDQETCACCWNTAVFDDKGQLYVLYRDKNPSDMALGQVNEQQWQRLNTVGEFNWDFEGCPHIGGGFAIDTIQKQFHATVSTGHEQHLGVYYLNSVDQGQSWSTPIQLGDSRAVHSDVAVANNGNLIAAWDFISDSGFQVVHSESNDQGMNWSKAKLLSADDKASSHPRVVAMQDNALILWTEKDVDGVHTLRMITTEPKND